VALKSHFSDKTNWRKMLTNDIINVDLLNEKTKVEKLLPEEAKPFFDINDSATVQLNYPVLTYPKKINSLSLEKTPNFEGKLIGIKGQYLIFEDGTVFNVRSSEGFIVKIKI
jgi:hypothetical protein